MPEFLQSLLAWVSAHPEWAYVLVFLVALSESLAIIGLLVPGAVLLVSAGALIALGSLAFWPTCLWAVAGAIVGDGLSYWVGYHFRERLWTLWPFSRYPDALERGAHFFRKYGGKSVAFGRFVGPVRAVIPLVAGMMGMGPSRFFLANVLSAFAWAPAYLLPGIVFGASLELAAEAAVNLVILGLSLVIGLWLLLGAVHRLFQFFNPRAGRWIGTLLRWAAGHPHLREVALALGDPRHPDAKTLAALAGLLVLTTLLLAGIAVLSFGARSELWINRGLLDLLLSLRTPLGDRLFLVLSRLGDPGTLLPLTALVYGWLVLKGARRQANYWLAAAAFGFLVGPLLLILLRASPPDGMAQPSAWAFPSLSVLSATLLYGMLALLMAGSLAPPIRWRVYGLAAVLIAAVSLAPLYLGTHWLTDVLGTLALGGLWLAILGLSLRRHTRTRMSWRALARVASLPLVFGLALGLGQTQDAASYQRVQNPRVMTESQWRTQGWQHFPRFRHDLRATGWEPMNLQYAGDPEALGRVLESRGWVRAERLRPGNLLRLLSPSLPLAALPLIPHVHEGRHESFAWVKNLASGERLALRLWATPDRLTDGRPLWLGTLTGERKRVLLGILAVPVTERDSRTPLERALPDLQDVQETPSPPIPRLLHIPRGTDHDQTPRILPRPPFAGSGGNAHPTRSGTEDLAFSLPGGHLPLL